MEDSEKTIYRIFKITYAMVIRDAFMLKITQDKKLFFYPE
jgi:hypothetical protein